MTSFCLWWFFTSSDYNRPDSIILHLLTSSWNVRPWDINESKVHHSAILKAVLWLAADSEVVSNEEVSNKNLQFPY